MTMPAPDRYTRAESIVSEAVRFLEKQDENFARIPAHFIRTANEERSIQKDYNGRQLLELLQNAADAALFEGTRVRIELSGTAILVANTGKPFGWQGIKSLLVAHNSPKQLDRNHYIGNRGLGFRSVLNWSSQPIIITGGLEIRFDADHAAKRVADLRKRAPELDAELAHYEAAGHPNLVPLLSYPLIVGILPEKPQEEDEDIQRARELHDAGFDTIVVLRFTEEGARMQALAQMNHLNEEIGLFVPQLTELTIADGDFTRVVTMKRKGNHVDISRNGEKTRWTVFRERGSIPENILAPGQPRGLHYEIAVAIPNRKVTTDQLWCYLPTAVKLNLPCRVHATLDLRNDRSTIREESSENRWILVRLAKLLVHAAVHQGTRDPWRRLELVTPREPMSDELGRLGFFAALLAEAKDAELAPLRREGVWAKPSDVKLLKTKSDFTPWLPLAGFKDVAPWRKPDHVTRLLDALGSTALGAADVTARVRKHASKYRIRERAMFLVGLVKEKSLVTEPPPPLLLYQPSVEVAPETPILLPPASFDHAALPAWTDVAFVDKALVKSLMGILDVKDAEALATLLEPFGVSEFRSDTVAAILAAGCRNPATSCERIPQMLPALLALWKAWKPEGSAEDSGIRVPLLTMAGTPADAESLYLGQDYPDGRLMHGLLSWKGEQAFVAAPEKLGLPPNSESFLFWCGVNRYPRQTRRRLQPLEYHGAFTEFQVEAAGGQITFGGYPYPASGSVLEYSNFVVIEDLDGILANASPEAILAWLHAERNEPGSLLASLLKDGDPQAKMTLRIRGGMRETSFRPRSFLQFKLRTTAWLRNADGQPRAPQECIVGEGDELAQFLDTPALDAQSEFLMASRMDVEDVNEELRRVGASPSIGDLSAEGIYKLLSRLRHGRFTDPDHARKATDAVLDALVRKARVHPSLLAEGPPGWFREQARMLGVFATAMQPFPISATVYVSDSRLARPVSELHPVLLASPGRYDAENIHRLLGCEVVKFEELAWKPQHAQLRPETAVINAALRANEGPLVSWLAAQGSPVDAVLAKTIEVRLCERLTVKALVGSHEIRVNWSPEDGELIEGRCIYLVDPPANGPHAGAHLQRVVATLSNQLSTIPSPTLPIVLTTVLLVPPEHARAVIESLTPRPPHPSEPEETGEAIEEPHPRPQAPDEPPTTTPPPEVVSPAHEPMTNSPPAAAPSSAMQTTNPPPPTQPRGPRTGVFEIVATHNIEPQYQEEDQGEGDEEQLPPRGLVSTEGIDASSPEHEGDDSSRDWRPTKSGGRNGFAGGNGSGARAPPWRRIRVRQARGGRSRGRGSGKNWEEVARQFEIAGGRVPWSGASEFVGRSAFGCDILSFANDQDRLAFVTALAEGAYHDYNLVVRFVEVKGASQGDARVFPTPNQLRRARMWGARYFLYVVQPTPTEGLYVLSEIQNPATQLVDVPGIVLSRTRRRVSTIKVQFE